jgi:stearoyl-CoA desaturase (delta-9 desaturase)
MISPENILVFATAFVFFSFFHTQGITLGYHRLLSHRSLKVPKFIEYFFVLGAYLSFEGSPIFWVATHRLHHRYSDHKGDPHSPRDGLLHAFISWMWAPKVLISKEESRMLAADLYRDPIYKMLHCGHTIWDGYLCLTIGLAYRALILFAFGPLVLAANLLATALAFLGPLLVNTVCHLRQYGYETYTCGDDSRNVPFVAFLAAGEGWHNNHHTFPQSARHGLLPKEFDATWLTISILEKLRLATQIRLPKKESHLVVPDELEKIGTLR